jgi:hypothetical protein
MARRGDVSVDERAAFVGDRVLTWSEVGRDATSAAERLRAGSGAYPLNAYVCDRSAQELGLQAGVSIDEESVWLIVQATVAVIVDVYDGEAFVALTR